MRTTFLFLAISLIINELRGQNGSQPFVIGETVELRSEALGEQRTLHIYRPEGFSLDSIYPVIYLLDGSADEDFIHVAGLVQFCNFSWIRTLPPAIVVGISNVDRRRDFTFETRSEKDQKTWPTTGGSERFIAFLETELQPFIEKKYRTSSSKMLVGQSLGGLLATEVLAKKPQLFSHFTIVSPSLWWDDESLLERFRGLDFSKNSAQPTVWIGVGKEGKIMERDAKKLRRAVEKSGLRVGFGFYKKENHATVFHRALMDAFEFLGKNF